jgi:hypothetical protein
MENFLEILVGFTLFGSILNFWFLTVGSAIVLLISEKHNSWFWLIFIILGYLVLIQGGSNFDIRESFSPWYLLYYLIIGFIYALIRTYFHGNKITSKKDFDNKKYGIKDKIIKWWVLFPLSFINWVLSDLLNDIMNFLYNRFDKLFEYVFKLGARNKIK